MFECLLTSITPAGVVLTPFGGRGGPAVLWVLRVRAWQRVVSLEMDKRLQCCYLTLVVYLSDQVFP